MNLRSKVVMVGAFPPPVHGMALVNASVRNQLRDAKIDLLVIDLSAPSLDRSLFARLQRFPKVVDGVWRLFISPDLCGRVLYMSVSGGLGQVYELIFLLLARIRHMKVVLNHHSFAYLLTPNFITRVLIRTAGLAAVHVTQSPRMAEQLQALYTAKSVVSITNAVFILDQEFQQIRLRQYLRVLGFISNIAVEKGVFKFLDLMAAIQSENLPIKAKLAGPFQDFETEIAVRRQLDQLSNVEYVGPKYGIDKDEFFAGIDALIFPTLYMNETEGIVNHEAMGRGIPVIAYGRGCIPEIIGADCGLVVPPADDFVYAAMTQIRAWIDSPQAFQEASAAAAKRFATLQIESLKNWEVLKANMLCGELH